MKVAPRGSLRLLAGLALGLAGLALNQWPVPLLTEETPPFVFGGALVLVAFVFLGTGPGLLASLVSLSAFFAQPGAAGLATSVYVLEAWATYHLYRRYGSLVFAVVAYWFSVGWLLDALLYGQMAGLPLAYVILLFVKQIFNGILNAIMAEVLTYLPAPRSLASLVRPLPAARLRQYVLSRVALVVMIPCLLLALIYTRSTYQRHLEVAADQEGAVAREAGTAVHLFLMEREDSLRRLAREIEIGRVAGREEPVARLAAFHREHPEFDTLGLTDAEGTVLATSPPSDVLGNRLAGQSLAPRRFFHEARVRQRTAYAPLSPGTVRLREAEKRAPVLLMAEPLLGAGGAFAGVVFGGLDSSALLPLLQAHRRHPTEIVTLLDQERTVIASLDPGLPGGTPLGADTPPRLAYAYQPLAVAAWGMEAHLPAASLHAEMMGSGYQILLFFGATLLLLYAAVLMFAGRMSEPLHTINRAATDIAAGHFPAEEPLRQLGSSPIGEIQSLASHFLNMQRALAYHDPVTGLPNRRLFLDRVTVAAAQARRNRAGLAVVSLDLDRFRIIEDSLGRALGNELLRRVARRLEGVVRAGDTVARLDADNFALLLAPVSQAEEAAKSAQKLLEALRRPFPLDGREVFVTACLGVSLYPADGENGEVLLRNADTAMSVAKQQGPDGYRLFAPVMNDRALEHLALEAGMRRAIAQGELLLHYQPQLELQTRSADAVEALVRWKPPGGPLLWPASFVPMAEASGLIVSLDHWVLRTACTQARAWQQVRPMRVAVNLSARQFHQPDLVEQVEKALREADLPAERLEIEITESVAMQGVDASVETLLGLRRLGVRLAVDDFGTGYSSLSYLKRLPVNTVKLDRSFTHDLATDGGDAAIARAVIDIAHSINLRVVAEGVETKEQLAFLRQHGCDAIQGFLVSHPLPADSVEPLFQPSAWLALPEGD